MKCEPPRLSPCSSGVSAVGRKTMSETFVCARARATTAGKKFTTKMLLPVVGKYSLANMRFVVSIEIYRARKVFNFRLRIIAAI